MSKARSRFMLMILFFSAVGPGLVVMLADTDAGSIITAAQSGAEWGYKLLLAQLILIPILYIAQELTVRLGTTTGMGHGELIKHHFGKYWAWLSVTTLMISCLGAIASEFSGIAGVGELFGISPYLSVGLAVLFLGAIVYSGTYRSVERIAIVIGLFELVFFVVAYKAHPNWHDIQTHFLQIPWHNHDYLFLLAANIGAVIMPWMIFYQQSAIVDKGLHREALPFSRWDTLIGAILTQCVMAAVLVATAATIGKTNPGASLNTVQEISRELTPYLGHHIGVVLFAFGMTGASMVAAIVVSLTAAWSLGEVTGYKRSLSCDPKRAPWFYVVYTVIILVGAGFVLSGVNLIKLNIGVEVMNAFLLPIVLGFLFLLATKALPEGYRLTGKYAWAVGIILFVTAGFGVMGGIMGL